MSLSVIPARKCISHILIKVVVLSLEIKDCTFKLSITLRLSGLNRPNDSNQVLQFAAHGYLPSFHFGLKLSGRQWSDLLHKGKYKCEYLVTIFMYVLIHSCLQITHFILHYTSINLCSSWLVKIFLAPMQYWVNFTWHQWVVFSLCLCYFLTKKKTVYM